MKTICKCEVCGNQNLIEVLDLGKHPLCDDLIPVGEEKVSNEYPIEILFCNNCLTAHQKYQVPKDILFTSNYHYRARMTGSVLLGMKDLVNSCEKRIGNLKNKLILDIGSNDGSLLDFFKEKGCKTIGVEPTRAANESDHYTINSFFDKSVVGEIIEKFGKPDLITFTNVFAHIDNLQELISNVKSLMKENTFLVIENHYLGSVLKYGQFDTFYHEHPRTYSRESFKHIAKKLDKKLTDVEFVSRYGGNIRVFISNVSNNSSVFDESNFEQKFSIMKNNMNEWIDLTKNKLLELVKIHGPLKAKAFPGRAAILVKLLDLQNDKISNVYEIFGSKKIYHYVPSTLIPILPEKELYKTMKPDDIIINLAWHLPEEVRSNLQKNNFKGDVINIREFKEIN